MHQEAKCDTFHGTLPGSCAPMVFPYIAMQENHPAVYDHKEAFENGTLFPGLNLPFFRHLKSKFKCNDPALCELMAMDFALSELGLYLDTHPDDKDAFAMFQNYASQYKTARTAYEKANGPLTQLSAANGDTYQWLHDPWPWEKMGGNK